MGKAASRIVITYILCSSLKLLSVLFRPNIILSFTTFNLLFIMVVHVDILLYPVMFTL